MKNNILVIDDINDNLISVKALFNDIFPEFQVSTAMNGRDGLNLASIENPDVILLDIIMPEMDGFEVCRLLKEDPVLHGIPILFFTALKETKENRINSLRAGAEGFISKPVDKIELEAQIKAMLKIRAANILNLNDKERLSKLVAQRTEDLEKSRVAIMNIMEDLKLENEAHKINEIKLKESEEKYRLLFDEAIDGQALADLDTGIIMDCNPALLKMIDRTKEEIVGQSQTVLHPPDEIHGSFSDTYQLHRTNGNGQVLEARLVTRSGELLPVDIKATQIEIQGRKLMYGVFRDITDRKQAEEQLRESEWRLKQSQELANIGHSDFYPALNVLRWSEGVFYIFGQDSATFQPRVENFDAPLHPDDLQRVIETRATALKNSVDVNVEYRIVRPGGEVRHIYMHTKNVLDEQGNLFRVMGTVQDITERKQAQEMLQKSHALLNSTGRMAKVGGWEVDLAAQTVTWTEEVYRIHEVEDDFVPNINTAINFYAPESRPAIEQTMQQAVEQGLPFDVQLQIITAKGNRRWVHAIGQAEQKDGKVTHVSGTFQDISERKQAEAELLNIKKLQDETEKIGGIGGWEFDVDNMTQTWTDGTFRILEMDSKNGAPKVSDGLTFILPLYKKMAEEAIQKAIEHGEPYDQEWEVITQKGNKLWVHSISKPIQEQGKVIKLRGSFQDITLRKQAEEALQSTIYELKKSQEVTKVGSWVWHIPQNRVEWSDEMYRIFSINKDLFSGDLTRVINESIHPDDRAEVNRSNASVMEKNNPIPLEYRIVRPDGSIRTVWAEAGELELDAEGKPSLLRGIVHDITERKQAEEEIKKQLIEKEVLLREVHHRVKNNIANIEGLLTLQADSNANSEVKTALQAAISRVQSMHILYDKLLMTKDYQHISIKSYAENLIDSIYAVFVLKNNITIEKHISEFNISSKKAISIGIIINELLTNVFKYAFKDRDKGNVSVSIEKKENRVTVSIQDNGIGIDEGIIENKSSGFGLTIVKMLVEQLKGTYSIVNENGTKSVIQFEI